MNTTKTTPRAALGALALAAALAGMALAAGIVLALSVILAAPAMADNPTRPPFVGRLGDGTRPDPEQLALACCDQDGICVWVDTFGECSFPESVYYCEWGASNSDGTVSCYD